MRTRFVPLFALLAVMSFACSDGAVGPTAVSAAQSSAPPVEGLGVGAREGDVMVLGRQVHWRVESYPRGLSLRYKARATDQATGIHGFATGLKSGKGAAEHAVENLFKELVARGLATVGQD